MAKYIVYRPGMTHESGRVVQLSEQSDLPLRTNFLWLIELSEIRGICAAYAKLGSMVTEDQKKESDILAGDC